MDKIEACTLAAHVSAFRAACATTPVSCSRVQETPGSDAWETCSGPVKASPVATSFRKIILSSNLVPSDDASKVPSSSKKSVKLLLMPDDRRPPKGRLVEPQSEDKILSFLVQAEGKEEETVLLATLSEITMQPAHPSNDRLEMVLLRLSSKDSPSSVHLRTVALAQLLHLQRIHPTKRSQDVLHGCLDLIPLLDAQCSALFLLNLELFIGCIPEDDQILMDIGPILWKDAAKFGALPVDRCYWRLVSRIASRSFAFFEHLLHEALSVDCLVPLQLKLMVSAIWRCSIEPRLGKTIHYDSSFKLLLEMLSKRIFASPSSGSRVLSSILTLLPSVLTIPELPIAPLFAKYLLAFAMQSVLSEKSKLDVGTKICILDSIIQFGSYLKSVERNCSTTIFDFGHVFDLQLSLEEKDAIIVAYKAVNTVEDEESRPRSTELSAHLGTLIASSLAGLVQRLSVFLLRLTTDHAALIKVKALRGLIVTVDMSDKIVENDSFSSNILSRTCDASVSVRDASLELIGKVIDPKRLTQDEFLSVIIERSQDSAALVRKRVVRIFRDVLERCQDAEVEEKIFARLVLMSAEDEDSVAAMATKLVQEHWFSKILTVTNRENLVKFAASAIRLITKLDPKVEALQTFFSRLRRERPGILDEIFVGVVDILFESLISSVETGNQLAVNFVLRAIIIFVSDRFVLLESHIRLLLELSHAKDMKTAELSLFLIKEAVLHCSKASIVHVIQQLPDIASFILKGTEPVIRHGCDVIAHSSMHFPAECSLLIRNLFNRFQAFLKSKRPQESMPLICRALFSYGYIVRKCIEFQEHMDLESCFDASNPLALLSSYYDMGMAKPPMAMLAFYAFQSIGFIISTSPQMSLLPDVVAIIRHSFRSKSPKLTGCALKFFKSLVESSSLPACNFETSMQPDEANVSSCVFQTFLDDILSIAHVDDPDCQFLVIKLFSEAVVKGVCHPNQVIPSIVALSTSTHESIAAKALDVIAILLETHSSFIMSNYACIIKSTFLLHQNAKMVSGGMFSEVDGCAKSLLSGFYELLRHKKQKRNDFVQILMKEAEEAFDTLDDKYGQFCLQTLALLPFCNLQQVAGLVIRSSDLVMSFNSASFPDLQREDRLKLLNFAVFKRFLQSAFELSIEKCEKLLTDPILRSVGLLPIGAVEFLEEGTVTDINSLLDDGVAVGLWQERPAPTKKSRSRSRKRRRRMSDGITDEEESLDDL